MQNKYPSLLASLGDKTATALSGSSAGASIGLVNNLPEAQKVIARAAFNESLRTMWIMYTAFAGMGLIISLFIGHRTLSKDHKVTKTGLAEEEIKRKELQEKKKLYKSEKGSPKAEV